MRTLTIAWLAPTLGDNWAIWNTECGMYRIDHYADDSFAPRRLITHKTPYGTERFWEYLGSHANVPTTLAEAMDVINRYHCATHNLVLV